MLVEMGYKTRVYPNKSQIEQIEKSFGCTRFVYNYFLEVNKERLELGEKKLNYNDESKVLTLLKEKHEWLKESDKFALQNSIKDLDRAFKNWFEKRAKEPKFHSKKNNYQSYRTNFTNGNIEINGRYIKLPKLGWIKFAKSKELNGKILNVTVSRQNDKYYISITLKTEIEPKPMPINREIGIDLGLKSFIVAKTDNDNVIDIKNPKYLEKSLKNLKRKQRQLSRKQHPQYKGDKTEKSKNYIKLQKRVAKIQAKIANQRRDFLHKLSTKIVSENQAIGIEDLAVSNLLKNHKLSRHIAQSGWRIFRTFLEYKAKWYGRELYVHNRFYPSSKLCKCGTVNKDLKLSDRLWICKACGAVNSRDELSADNLKPSTRGRGEFKPVEYALAGANA